MVGDVSDFSGAASDPPKLEVREVVVRYGDTTALAGADLAVAAGDIVAVLGPSGCGKSTLLRAIAGLEPLDAGTIAIDGRDLAGVPPHRRGVGMMFQSHALFPHRSVADNVGFGLELRGDPPERRRARIEELLETVGLVGYGDRSVTTLSGGEAQRVSLARTLAPEPSFVMLDEPMGSLDRALRERLAVDVRRTLRAEGVAALVVTHDQDEAFTVADMVAVMNRGRLIQHGSPEQVRRSPVSRFVAAFVGLDAVIDVVVGESGEFDLAGLTLHRPDWPTGSAAVAVPTEAVSVVQEGPGAAVGPARHLDASSADGVADGTATAIVVGEPRFRGDHYLVGVEAAGDRLSVTTTEAPTPGERLSVVVDPARLVRLDR